MTNTVVQTVEYFPAQMFRDKTPAACPVLQFPAIPGTGTNFAAPAGIAGKLIRVLSINLGAEATTRALVTFKNGTGGAVLQYYSAPPNTVQDAYYSDAWGIFDTTTLGTGLFYDVATNGVHFTLRYIYYTP